MTSIEWTDETWNPIRARRKDGGGRLGWACVRVSRGCVNCYAATQNMSDRAVGGTGLDYTVPNIEKVEIVMLRAHLEKPLHWRTPRRVFVCSMTDLFGEFVTDEQIDDVFDIMARCPQHTFQVLTKRPERMREWIAERGARVPGVPKLFGGYGWLTSEPWPPPNVWLGVSVEDQRAADERIPQLLATPAAVRFVSAEPLIGPIDLSRFLSCVVCGGQRVVPWSQLAPGASSGEPVDCPHCCSSIRRDKVDWLIVGGESGPRARPMDIAWLTSLVESSKAAGVPVFVKQDNGPRPGMKGRISDALWLKEFPDGR